MSGEVHPNAGLCLFLTVLLSDTALSIVRLALQLLLLLLTLPAPLSPFDLTTHKGTSVERLQQRDD